MEGKWVKEKENLERLINIENRSYEEIGRIYGCSGSNIKKVAIRLDIKLTQRRNINESETFNKGIYKNYAICENCGKKFVHYYESNGKFCCRKCSSNYKHTQGYKRIVDGDEEVMRPNFDISHYKNDILQEQDCKCAICGMKSEWNGKPLIFVLDHIDGHAANNKRDNLRCICPNCDSQLDTYKSKNKNSDRHYYRHYKNK